MYKKNLIGLSVLSVKIKRFIYLVTLFCLILSFISCGNKVRYISKRVIRTDSGEQITIDVPESCDKFSNGIKASLDAMVKYGSQEASLRATYDKITLISEYADRIKTITIAQCKNLQYSPTIDPSSDYDLYSNLVKNYTEYQKVKDLIDKGPSEQDMTLITKSILEVYSSVDAHRRGVEEGEAVGFIVGRLDRFYKDNGKYPSSLDELVVQDKRVNDRIKILGANRIDYQLNSDKGFVLRFAGEDGRLNTGDDKIHYSKLKPIRK